MKIIFLGIQGSGKSTQAKLLANKVDLPHIEMGQLLRVRARQKDKEGSKIKKILDAGKLMADDVVIATLKNRISRSDCRSGYILDGFPRSFGQLQGLESDIDKVFYIKVSDQEGLRRLTKRGRHDDDPASIKRRLELYHQKTKPLLSYFQKKGILEEIDGERTIEEIEKDIGRRIKNATKE